MNPDIYDQSEFLISKAAYLYYIKDLSQNEIANDLGISITTVSRLLKKAKEQNIVEFVIRDPFLKCIDVECKLKERFHLKDVVVAPTINSSNNDSTSSDYCKKIVALESARYLQRIIRDDDILGISWGSTIFNMINYLNPAQKVNAAFVTLHGSISCIEPELDARNLVSRISKVFAGRQFSLLLDGLMANTQTVDILRQEKKVEIIYNMFKKINISVTGIGSFYPNQDSVLSRTEFINEKELAELHDSDVVGDICLRFFDRSCNECLTSLCGRTIAIDMADFKNIPSKITIASGIRKTYPILCALKGGLIDILIVDYQLGESLLLSE
jgi:Transcriptional regulator, contains sigma factor-related N-terminal domain